MGNCKFYVFVCCVQIAPSRLGYVELHSFLDVVVMVFLQLSLIEICYFCFCFWFLFYVCGVCGTHCGCKGHTEAALYISESGLKHCILGLVNIV